MKNDLKEYGISIKKFLKIYMGISDEKLLNSKISHKDIKVLIPNLIRLPYDYVLKNMKDILSGEVIIVVDDFGNYIPYKTPTAQFDILEDSFYREKNELESDLSTKIAYEELEKLNTYQLSEVCKKYKKHNRNKEYRIAYRILKKKKENEQKTSKYRKGKIKI